MGTIDTLTDVSLAANSGAFGPTNMPLSRGDVLTYDPDSSQSGKWVNWPKRAWNGHTGNYTLNYVDNSTFGEWSGGGGPFTVTIPLSATTPLPFNFNMQARQGTAGNAAAQITVAGAGGVTVNVPAGRSAKSRMVGSIINIRKRSSNTWHVDGDTECVAHTVGQPEAIDYSLKDTEIYNHTPNSTQTQTATAAPIGKRVYFIITTSGTSSFVITFGSGYKSTGTLTTGTVSGAVFVIQFIGDGTNMLEVSRTTAM